MGPVTTAAAHQYVQCGYHLLRAGTGSTEEPVILRLRRLPLVQRRSRQRRKPRGKDRAGSYPPVPRGHHRQGRLDRSKGPNPLAVKVVRLQVRRSLSAGSGWRLPRPPAPKGEDARGQRAADAGVSGKCALIFLRASFGPIHQFDGSGASVKLTGISCESRCGETIIVVIVRPKRGSAAR